MPDHIAEKIVELKKRQDSRKRAQGAERKAQAAANPSTRCWSCGLTLAEHAPHRDGRPAFSRNRILLAQAPWYTTLPFFMRIKLSNISKILGCGWWMVHTAVHSPTVDRFFKALHTAKAVVLSRPEVGSSRKMSLGRLRSSMATHRRLRSPPEMPLRRVLPTMVLAQCPMPMRSVTCWTRRSRSASVVARGMRSWAAQLRVSSTVSSACSRSSCMT